VSELQATLAATEDTLARSSAALQRQRAVAAAADEAAAAEAAEARTQARERAAAEAAAAADTAARTVAAEWQARLAEAVSAERVAGEEARGRVALLESELARLSADLQTRVREATARSEAAADTLRDEVARLVASNESLVALLTSSTGKASDLGKQVASLQEQATSRSAQVATAEAAARNVAAATVRLVTGAAVAAMGASVGGPLLRSHALPLLAATAAFVPQQQGDASALHFLQAGPTPPAPPSAARRAPGGSGAHASSRVGSAANPAHAGAASRPSTPRGAGSDADRQASRAAGGDDAGFAGDMTGAQERTLAGDEAPVNEREATDHPDEDYGSGTGSSGAGGTADGGSRGADGGSNGADLARSEVPESSGGEAGGEIAALRSELSALRYDMREAVHQLTASSSQLSGQQVQAGHAIGAPPAGPTWPGASTAALAGVLSALAPGYPAAPAAPAAAAVPGAGPYDPAAAAVLMATQARLSNTATALPGYGGRYTAHLAAPQAPHALPGAALTSLHASRILSGGTLAQPYWAPPPQQQQQFQQPFIQRQPYGGGSGAAIRAETGSTTDGFSRDAGGANDAVARAAAAEDGSMLGLARQLDLSSTTQHVLQSLGVSIRRASMSEAFEAFDGEVAGSGSAAGGGGPAGRDVVAAVGGGPRFVGGAAPTAGSRIGHQQLAHSTAGMTPIAAAPHTPMAGAAARGAGHGDRFADSAPQEAGGAERPSGDAADSSSVTAGYGASHALAGAGEGVGWAAVRQRMEPPPARAPPASESYLQPSAGPRHAGGGGPGAAGSWTGGSSARVAAPSYASSSYAPLGLSTPLSSSAYAVNTLRSPAAGRYGTGGFSRQGGLAGGAAGQGSAWYQPGYWADKYGAR
jgi:hypothetical protein